MVEEKIFEKIEDFYEAYREIKISENANKNLITNSSLHNQLMNKFTNKFNESCKIESNFSKYINKNGLNLLDMEIETITKFFQHSELDDKEIFDKLLLYNFKEYDFELFRRYFINSNLIKKKIITYSINDDEDKVKHKKLTNKENKKLSGMKIINKFNLYSNLKQIKTDFNYYSYLEENLINIENNHDKKAASKLIKKIKLEILSNISLSKNNLNFINELKLNEFETIILLEIYFKNQSQNNIEKMFHYNDSSPIIKKNIINKYSKSLEKKLLNLSLIKKENQWGEEVIILSNKLISIIENRNITDDEKQKDNDLFIQDSFLKPIISSIKIDDVYIEETKKNILKRTLSQVENYDLIFNEWGMNETVGYGRGLIMNFYGLPGTGKTMLAKSIGNYLDKKIIEIDFSQLQDAYVGGTEKNISKAFKVAKEQDAILFFDEADSLIQNRSKAKNSWEKSQTNVLLKEIENFDGVCIFATNFLESYDPAIERRIALNLEFDLPGSELRSKIFEGHFSKKEILSEDVDFISLGKKFDFTGGEIKNSIMHAVRLAASDEKNSKKKIQMKHLKFGCELVQNGKFNNIDSSNDGIESDIYM